MPAFTFRRIGAGDRLRLLSTAHAVGCILCGFAAGAFPNAFGHGSLVCAVAANVDPRCRDVQDKLSFHLPARPSDNP